MSSSRPAAAGSVPWAAVMELDVIDLPAAVALLRTRVPDLPEDAGRGDRRGAGRLPLALEQAAAYLDRSAMPAGDYLGLLRRGPRICTREGGSAGGTRRSPRLWDISLERISRREPGRGRSCWSMCAYLAPEPIPLDLFTCHAELLPEPLSAAAADPLAFNEVIAVAGGLLAGQTDRRRACRCTGWCKASSAPGTPSICRDSRRRAGRHDQLRQQAAGWLGVVLGLLRADAPGTIMGAPEDWPRWAVLLPHVLAATGHFEPARAAGHGRASFLAAGRRRHLPAGPCPAGRGPAAGRTGPGHRRGRLRPRPPHVAIRLNNLALILRDLGQPEQARPLAERALAIDEAAYGPDHPDVAIRLNNLAQILAGPGPARAGPAAGRTGPGHRARPPTAPTTPPSPSG